MNETIEIGREEISELLELCEDNEGIRINILGWLASIMGEEVKEQTSLTNYFG